MILRPCVQNNNGFNNLHYVVSNIISVSNTNTVIHCCQRFCDLSTLTNTTYCCDICGVTAKHVKCHPYSPHVAPPCARRGARVTLHHLIIVCLSTICRVIKIHFQVLNLILLFCVLVSGVPIINLVLTFNKDNYIV